MKKLVLIICIMFSIYSSVNAQITLSNKSTIETIARCRMGYVTLYMYKNLDYKSYYISFPTTNKFDNSMIIELGNTKNSAIQTINDLINLITELKKEDYITINDANNTSFIVNKKMGTLYFDSSGYAGLGNIAKFELEKLRNALLNSK